MGEMSVVLIVGFIALLCTVGGGGGGGQQQQPLYRDKKPNYTFIPSQLCPLLVAW